MVAASTSFFKYALHAGNHGWPMLEPRTRNLYHSTLMDDDVIKAMARWPDVPAVYGWLSLDMRGRWRLYPLGDAAAGGSSELVTHPGVVAFFNRNYGHEGQDWYVQNGPQRVYVRLDAAPFLLRLADTGPGLQAHTGQQAGPVSQWWLDEDGNLYARTNLGPGMIEDRDLAALLDRLRTTDGDAAGLVLEALLADTQQDPAPALALDGEPPAPLARIARAEVPALLGFHANPVQTNTRL
jgi:hypothetical protein